MRLVQKTEINLVWPEYKFEFSCSENLDRWTEATSWKALCVIFGKMDCPPECFYKNTFKTIYNFSKIIFSYLKAIHIQSNFFTKYRNLQRKSFLSSHLYNFKYFDIYFFQPFYEYNHGYVFKRKQNKACTIYIYCFITCLFINPLQWITIKT